MYLITINYAIYILKVEENRIPRENRVMRDIEQAVKELLNDGYLILQHKDRVSINPRMLKEIKEIIV